MSIDEQLQTELASKIAKCCLLDHVEEGSEAFVSLRGVVRRSLPALFGESICVGDGADEVPVYNRNRLCILEKVFQGTTQIPSANLLAFLDAQDLYSDNDKRFELALKIAEREDLKFFNTFLKYREHFEEDDQLFITFAEVCLCTDENTLNESMDVLANNKDVLIQAMSIYGRNENSIKQYVHIMIRQNIDEGDGVSTMKDLILMKPILDNDRKQNVVLTACATDYVPLRFLVKCYDLYKESERKQEEGGYYSELYMQGEDEDGFDVMIDVVEKHGGQGLEILRKAELESSCCERCSKEEIFLVMGKAIRAQENIEEAYEISQAIDDTGDFHNFHMSRIRVIGKLFEDRGEEGINNLIEGYYDSMSLREAQNHQYFLNNPKKLDIYARAARIGKNAVCIIYSADRNSKYNQSEDRLNALIEVGIAQGSEVMGTLCYNEGIYKDDDDIFAEFKDLAKVKGGNAVISLIQSKGAYEQEDFNWNRFNLFVELLKAEQDIITVGGVIVRISKNNDYWTDFIKAVGKAYEAYGDSDWRLAKFLEFGVNESGHSYVSTLAEIFNVYGNNDDRFKQCLRIIRRGTNDDDYFGMQVLYYMSAFEPIYHDDDEKFLECVKIAEYHKEREKNVFCNPEVVETCTGSDEIFNEFYRMFFAGEKEKMEKLAEFRKIYKSNFIKFEIVLDLFNRKKIDDLNTLKYVAEKIDPFDEKMLRFFVDTCEKESSFVVERLADARGLYGQDMSKLELAVPFVKLTSIYDEPVVFDEFSRFYNRENPETATSYLSSLHEQSKCLIPQALAELRAMPEYMYMVKYVFPDGNYSTYEKNLACGDHLDHLEGYEYDKAGYPTELTGLLGYRVKPSAAEGDEAVTRVLDRDEAELEKYKARTDRIREFVGSRGPNNEALQKAFDEKVDIIFEVKAHERFKEIEGLSMKEKLLTLFISEAHKRAILGSSYKADTDVLDLVVEYKYAYNEDLEAYYQRTADTAKSQPDRASRCYSYWSELSVLYGENVKHVLRHDIFENLAEGGEHYAEIVDRFGQIFEVKAEGGFELTVRQKVPIERILNQEFGNEQLRFEKLVDKLVDDLGDKKPPEPIEPVEPENLAETATTQQKKKHENQLKVYAEQKIAYEKRKEEHPEALRLYKEANQPFRARIVEALDPIRNNLTLDGIEERLQRVFPVDPGIERRIQGGIFENPNVSDKFNVLLRQCRLIFGANIRFEEKDDDNGKKAKEAEAKERFNRRIEEIIEPCREDLTMVKFQEVLPKLQSLRKEYRFDVNSKLEELFSVDINRIFKELDKYEEVIEEEAKEKEIGGLKENIVGKSAKKRKIRGYFTKTKETANARMGAYLCIAGDQNMWRNKNYLETVFQDEDTSECVGLSMYLNIGAKDGKKYLWFGPNPFESFLDKVSSKACYDYMYKTAVEFAKNNGYDAIVVPPKDEQIHGQCTNRGGDFPQHIKDSRIKDRTGNLITVDFGGAHELGGGYKYSSGALLWKKEEKKVA